MSKHFKIITNILIGILSFVLVCTIALCITAIRDDLSVYVRDEDSLLYNLEMGDYSYLVKSAFDDQITETKPSQAKKECYAVAEYYVAAIDYRLALLKNDSQLQKEAEEAMAEAAEAMGDLSYAKEEIDEFLDQKQ